MKTFWQDESQEIEQEFEQKFLIMAFAQDDILKKLGGQKGLCWGIGFEVIRKCKFNICYELHNKEHQLFVYERFYIR
jgi:hypothetical protein